MTENNLIKYGPSDRGALPSERPGFYSLPSGVGELFDQQKHLRDYVCVAMRHKWAILACIVITATASAAYTFHQTPMYQAVTKVEINMEEPAVLMYTDFNRQPVAFDYLYEEYLQTQIKHITSKGLSIRVAEAAGFDRENEIAMESKTENAVRRIFSTWIYDAKPASKIEVIPRTREERIQQAAGRILGGLSVTPIKNSHVVEIGFSSPDPKIATHIVNILAHEYIEYSFENKFNSISRITEFLQKQLIDLKAKLENSEKALVNYARRNSITNIGEKLDVVTQSLGELNTKLTEAQSVRIDKESSFKTFSDATPENFPQALRNSLIQKLEEDLASNEQELARLSSQLGSGMPQIKQLQSRLRQIQEQLRIQKQLAIENARNEYKTALAREMMLREVCNRQKALVNDLNRSSIEYNMLKREADTNKQLYDSVLQRIKEANVSAGFKSNNIQVVEAAEAPTSPISPDVRKNLALALALGPIGGLGLAFFLNYMDNTIKTAKDAELQIGLPSLGVIPSLKSACRYHSYFQSAIKRKTLSNALTKRGVELALLASGSSPIAEAYRGLRSTLLYSNPHHSAKSIAVTSARGQEGKTTTVCNLALSLTQAGKNVLIVDCNLRRPRIGKIFQQNGNGLSEYLAGQIDFDQVVSETSIPNLFLVSAGAIPPNPGELLGSKRMQEALWAAGAFDFVIIDTPSLALVNDSMAIATMTDGVILVTLGGKHPPEVLKNAKRDLDRVHASILGVLINKVDLCPGDQRKFNRAHYRRNFHPNDETDHDFM
jgi:capsular exopolysaccharide synthesis family protein